MPIQQVSIVHLSDLHLTAADNQPRSEPKLFGKLTGMNAAFRQLLSSEVVQKTDHIIITGDVTDSGQVDQWQIFWDAVTKTGVKDRLIIVPGNHDMCCLDLRLTPSAQADMDRFNAGLKLGGLAPQRYPSLVRLSDELAVLVVNSNNLGNATGATNAVGEIAYFDLVRLAELLYQLRDVPVKIVALHHSPNIPEAATAKRRNEKPMSIIERLTHQIPQAHRRALRLLCLSHRVRLVVHGHLHACEERFVNGIRIIGAPARTAPVEGNGMPIYQFWRYTIVGKTHRLRHRLITIPVT